MTQTICYPFIGDSVGGAHLSALQLIRYIDKTRYRPIIVLHEEGVLAEYLTKEGVKYIKLPLGEYAGAHPSLISIIFAAIKAIPSIWKFLGQNKVSLVHCNDLRTNLTWMLACRLARVRFVWHQRTQANSDHVFWKLIPWFVDHCIAISQTSAKPFQGAGRRLSIIKNPISVKAKLDRQGSRNALIKELGTGENVKFIGYVGRLVSAKQPKICIDVLSELSKRGQGNTRLLIFGRGSEAFINVLKAHTRARGVENQVHFMGFRSSIENAIAGLNVLIVPSEKEGFGRTIIEAMLLKTPLIASNIAAHRETVSDKVNGLLAPVGNVQCFTDATLSILRNSAMSERLVSNGYKLVSGNYSSEEHVVRVQNLYSSLIRKTD